MKNFLRLPILLTAWCMMISVSVHAQVQPNYAELVPEDLIYFHQAESAKDDAFPNAYKAVSEWTKTLDDILEWRILKSEWDALTAELSNSESRIAPVCGDSYAVAISGFGDNGKIPSLLYLSYVHDIDASKEVLANFFEYVSNIHEIIQYEQDQFRGFEIHSLYGPGGIPGLGLSFTWQENLLIISTSKPYLVDFTDQLGFTNNTLSNVDVYKEAISRLPQNHSAVSFLNASQLTVTLDELLKMGKAFQEMENDPDMAAAFGTAEVVVEYVKKFHYYASAQQRPVDDVYTKTGIIHYDPSIIDTPFGSLFEHKATAFDFASYLPRKTGSYQAGNILSLSEVWGIYENVLEIIPESGNVKSAVKDFEKETGISIEDDILSWMGSEWCWIKPVMTLDALVPTNEMAVMFTVKDQAKAQAALAKLQAMITDDFELPVMIETTDYRGTELTSFRLPIPLIPFTPSWAIGGGIFILSTHDTLIRTMLDVKAGAERGIDRNPYYNQLKNRLDTPSNLVKFQDLETEFYTYREAIKRVSSITGLGAEFLPEGEMMPFQIMDRIAYLISCFQVMKASAKHNIISDEEWQITTSTIMKDLSSVPNLQGIKRGKFSLGAKQAIIQLAGFLIQVGQEERAMRIFTILGEFYPDDKQHLLDAANAFRDAGNKEKANALLNEAVESSSQPSVFIELAKSQHFTSANEVQSWLTQLVGENSECNKAAVYMGIALHARANENNDLANGLFQMISKMDQYPTLQNAAFENDKSSLLGGQTVNNINIPVVTVYPTIDGYKDEAWGDEAEKSLSIQSPSTGGFTLHLSRSGAQIYCLAEMQASNESIQEESLELYLNTNNQYNPVHVITLKRSGSDSSSITKQAQKRVIDHWDIFPDHSTENLNTNWPVGHGHDDNLRIIEFSFPLSMVAGSIPETMWGINAKYEVQYESGESKSAWLMNAANPDAPDDPFGYININL